MKSAEGQILAKCAMYLAANRKICSKDIIDESFNFIDYRGITEHLHSDNGPEFKAKAIRIWLNRLGVKTLYIELDSP